MMIAKGETEFKVPDHQESAKNLPPRALSDSEIGRLWAKHFPQWRDNRDSCQICFGICAIIEFEAALRNGPTHIARVNDALQAAGIRPQEFDEVKAEKVKVDARGLLYPKPGT